MGPDIGGRAFAEWFASQAKAEKVDKNLESIVDALRPLIQEGKLPIRRGGFLVRRGRGRLIVEPGEAAPSPIAVGVGIGSTEAQEMRQAPAETDNLPSR